MYYTLTNVKNLIPAPHILRRYTLYISIANYKARRIETAGHAAIGLPIRLFFSQMAVCDPFINLKSPINTA